ncbi:response regulator [Quatrionicoccus australiensis]|uniref:response regulator n=1 Tax=Quatrionicoccus australiensis TaxID=138118 RepID=UPI001CF90019|nr:response regulator transcription factor [Quatrionicoccus australiensis]UCV13965.1 response regulator transcription factor [Quatrionicoccus australiensis]
MIRILIADDHDILRAGLKHILHDTGDIVVAGEACDGHQALSLVRTGQWDALVLDLSMPGKSGIELIKQIKGEFPRLPILILSMHKEDLYAVRALKAGASGYLCKDSAEALLAQAIRKVVGGGLFVNQAVAEKLAMDMLTGAGNGAPHSRLTDREYQVFMLLARGLGVTDIGRELNLSVKTISTHKTRIQEKMNLANTADLIHYAIRHQLIGGPDGLDA